MNQNADKYKVLRRAAIALSLLVAIVLPYFLIASEIDARIASIAAFCLVLWLSEAVPPFVPTLLLWTLATIFLSPLDARYSLSTLLGWGADPVVALFFGGFALGVAAQKSGIDLRIANSLLRWSGNSPWRLLALIMAATAFFSMWLSNIAAAALLIACVRPLLKGVGDDSPLRRQLLLAIAFAANIGGIATPVGTGPNAVAIAAMRQTREITFIEWMTFALPLAAGMLILAFVLINIRGRLRGTSLDDSLPASSLLSISEGEFNPRHSLRQRLFLLIIGFAILFWLAEPLTGIPAPAVALAAAAALFLTSLLKKDDLGQIDWPTLLLIAGGITLGRLLESSGIVSGIASAINYAGLSETGALLAFCLLSALLAALMSNTASVILLIPIAAAIVPMDSTPILIAIAASFGMPFIISTPPNAMAYGEGGPRAEDFFWPGLAIMIAGCLLIATTGPAVLRFHLR